jgi:hypothetical protein
MVVIAHQDQGMHPPRLSSKAFCQRDRTNGVAFSIECDAHRSGGSPPEIGRDRKPSGSGETAAMHEFAVIAAVQSEIVANIRGFR